MTHGISTASNARIQRFIDSFIRSEYVQAYQESAISSDFGLDGRFSRCMDAAKDGCDGSTHAEIIQDWRGAFESMLQDRRGHEYPERFATAVNVHFDNVEVWHEQNGSLFQQIG